MIAKYDKSSYTHILVPTNIFFLIGWLKKVFIDKVKTPDNRIELLQP